MIFHRRERKQNAKETLEEIDHFSSVEILVDQFH